MIISSPTVHGCGQIASAFVSPECSVLAIASSFPLLTNRPARAAYAGQKLRHRVSLHQPGEQSPFALFDSLRLPVNWIGFHPSQSVVVIAAGSYDGGWMFDGELVLWNWIEDKWWRPVEQVPEVVLAEFGPDGTTLDLIVRPWDEEWGGSEENSFTRFYQASVSADPGAAGSEFVLDAALRLPEDGIEKFAVADAAHRDAEERVAAWLGVSKLDKRGGVWDVAWLGSGKIASVSDDCLLRIDDIGGADAIRIEGNGYGAAIVGSEPPLIHVAQQRGWTDCEVVSRLLAVHDGGLVEIGSYPGVYTFTASPNGTVLGRLDRHQAGTASTDVVIEIATGAATPIDLGHYDCFNHFVGIEYAPAHYFLQSTPPQGHERKRLCRLGTDYRRESLWPVLAQDGTHGSHAMECCGCYLEDAAGAAIVLAGKHYDPNPHAPTRGFIYRKGLDEGQELWRHPTAAASSAVVYIPEHGVIVATFLDGSLKVVEAVTGAIRTAGMVTIDAQPTVVFSLAATSHSLALGTLDGRVVMVDHSALLSVDGTIGKIELA